jgi:hypothetical protein
MHVQGSSLPLLPNGAAPLFDAIVQTLTREAVRDLGDDYPGAMMAALPRYLLFPPESGDLVGQLPDLIITRVRRLVGGDSAGLWGAFDWVTALGRTGDAIRRVTPDMYPKIMRSVLTSVNPGRVFRRLKAIPFCPPTDAVRQMLETKVPSKKNDDDDRLRDLADEHMPRRSLGQGSSATGDLLTKTVATWGGAIHTSPVNGAPDGTGFRFVYLQNCPTALASVAIWLSHLSSHRISPFMFIWLCMTTIAAQCKTDDAGQYPATAADILSVRPISRLSIFRRLMAKVIAPLVCRALRFLLEALRQYGLSPSGCQAASRTAQLHCDLHPRRPHGPVDVKNAHSAIRRLAIIRVLIQVWEQAVKAEDILTRIHRAHLEWNLSFYTRHPTRVYIQVSGSPAFGPFFQMWQTEALLQGDGMATPSFNLPYTTLLVPTLLSHFPPRSVDHLLIHDDTTIFGDTYRAPPDDPGLIRLRALSDARLIALIDKVADRLDAGDFTARSMANYYNDPQRHHCPHQSVADLGHYVIPHFPLVIAVFAEIIRERLHLHLAEGAKMKFYQRRLPTADRDSLRAPADTPSEPNFWARLLLRGVRFTHDTYTLAGAAVGSYAQISRSLMSTAAPYVATLEMLTSMPDIPIYPTYIAIKMAFTPGALFGHHLGAQPPSISAAMAAVTRVATLRSLERLLGVTEGSISGAPASHARDVRACAPVSEGGCGLTDPVAARLPGFTGTFINIIGYLLENEILRPALLDTGAWPGSPSRILSEAHMLLLDYARAAAVYAPRPDPDAPTNTNRTDFFTSFRGAVNAGGGIDAVRLARAGQNHGQRHLARLAHRRDFAARIAKYPLNDHAAATINSSKARGAQALYNAVAISDFTKLDRPQAQFLLCGRIGAPLPFLHSPYQCHPDCANKRLGCRHGFHMMQCPKFYLPSLRHNAMLRLIATVTDRWMGYMCLEGRYLEHTEAKKTAVDLLIMDPHHVNDWPLMADLTLSCVNLGKSLTEVCTDINRLFDRRTKEKDKKHAKACFNAKRSFLAMVFTTEGSACHEFFVWWDRSWALATTLHELAGGNARTVARAKQQSMASLQAISVRHTANAIRTLHAALPPEVATPVAAPAGAPAANPAAAPTAARARNEAGTSAAHGAAPRPPT